MNKKIIQCLHINNINNSDRKMLIRLFDRLKIKYKCVELIESIQETEHSKRQNEILEKQEGEATLTKWFFKNRE